jgi:chromate reductase
MKNILAIIGSTSKKSANRYLVNVIRELASGNFSVTIADDLAALPHFSPEASVENTPQVVLDFRKAVQDSDGIIICTPEYIFSIPSVLKNAFEWCVSVTVFSHKPVGLITASASGQKAHEELKLIAKTIECNFTEGTTLLIQGIKGKIDAEGNLTDTKTMNDLKLFVKNFDALIHQEIKKEV